MHCSGLAAKKHDDDNYDSDGDDMHNNDVDDDLDHEDDDDMFHDPRPELPPYQYDPFLLPAHGELWFPRPDPTSIHYTHQHLVMTNILY